MSYFTQARLAADGAIRERTIACAVSIGVDEPQGWAISHMWQLSAVPGWDEAYEAALNAKNPSPGEDESVITDAMILAAVQALNSPSE